MNDQKLKKLFAAARQEKPAAPAEGFDLLVMQAVRRDSSPRGELPALEPLEVWFPRLAWAAVAVIGLCVAGDFAANAQLPGISEGVATLSQQWLLTGGGI